MAVKPGNSDVGGSERDLHLDLLYLEAPREMPPPHLAAAILAAARREAGARPRALSAQFRRWRVPVSIAAIVVLSVSLVMLVKEEEGYPLRERRAPAAPPAPRAAEPATPPAAEQRPAPGDRPRAVAKPEGFSSRRDETAESRPAKPRRKDEAAAPGAAPVTEARRRSDVPAEADVKAAAPGLRGQAPGSLADSAPQAPAIAAQRRAPEAPAPTAAAAPPMARRMQSEALAVKRPPAWQDLDQEPPQKWLERAAELKRQGRTAEVDELLAEFKRRFPDQPLPAGVE